MGSYYNNSASVPYVDQVVYSAVQAGGDGPPGATDDIANTSGNGYAGVGWYEGSLWTDLNTGTVYVCTDSTENAAVWVAVAGPHINTDPDALPVESISRKYITGANSITMTSGILRLAMFTQPKTYTASSVVLMGGSTAAGATPTLVRGGFYSVASNGDATLVCACASDTALFATQNVEYTRSFSTGGGLPATYTFVAGQRYAAALLVTSGATLPTVRGNANGIAATMVRSPVIAAAISGQTDLPTSITNATITGASSVAIIQQAAV